MLEYKGREYKTIYTGNNLTDDLHKFLDVNIDSEILTYKKFKMLII